jgi:glycosyltransferase involved in cell wall biosynthesis
MKVLINSSILSDKHTGYATVISNYINELSTYLTKESKNLEIYVLLQEKAYKAFFRNMELNKNIKFIVVKNFSIIGRLLYDQILINYFLYKYNCDVLHSPATIGTMFSIRPQILFFHASTTFMLPRDMHGRGLLATWLSNVIIKYSALKSKRVLTTSNVTGKELESFLGKKIGFTSIYNGIPLIDENYIVSNVRESIISLKNKKFIFYVSSFYKLKNQEILINAAKLNKDYIFVIGGSPVQKSYYDYCVVLIKNIDNAIIFDSLNFDEVKFLYKHTDAYVCPSFFEGFALTPLEALIFNKPILLANTDILKEVYGEDFLYFDPNNPESLNHMIEKVDEKYKKICTNNKILKKYTWNNFLLSNLKVYDELNEKK